MNKFVLAWALSTVIGLLSADSVWAGAVWDTPTTKPTSGEKLVLTAIHHQPLIAVPDVTLPSVVSINLCADQLVLLLADASQIKALSTLSLDESGSYFYTQAKRYKQADARAEDILPLSPDVVLTGAFTSRYTLTLLNELGVEVQSLNIANSISAMLENIQRVGQILGQETRAEELIQQLQERLEHIRKRVDTLDSTMRVNGEGRPRAAVYDANGYTVGRASMRGEALDLAGWHNVAEDVGIDVYGVLALEALIRLSPEALIESPYSAGTYSRGQMLTEHPALRQSGLDPLIIALPSSHTICAGPWSVDVIEHLLAARESLLSD